MNLQPLLDTLTDESLKEVGYLRYRESVNHAKHKAKELLRASGYTLPHFAIALTIGEKQEISPADTYTEELVDDLSDYMTLTKVYQTPRILYCAIAEALIDLKGLGIIEFSK